MASSGPVRRAKKRVRESYSHALLHSWPGLLPGHLLLPHRMPEIKRSVGATGAAAARCRSSIAQLGTKLQRLPWWMRVRQTFRRAHHPKRYFPSTPICCPPTAAVCGQGGGAYHRCIGPGRVFQDVEGLRDGARWSTMEPKLQLPTNCFESSSSVCCPDHGQRASRRGPCGKWQPASMSDNFPPPCTSHPLGYY